MEEEIFLRVLSCLYLNDVSSWKKKKEKKKETDKSVQCL